MRKGRSTKQFIIIIIDIIIIIIIINIIVMVIDIIVIMVTIIIIIKSKVAKDQGVRGKAQFALHGQAFIVTGVFDARRIQI